MVVIAIVAIIVTMAIIGYRFLERETELESEARNIESTLKLAQTKTLASEGGSQYGVHFTSDSYTLFQGAAYNPVDPQNKVYTLPSRLGIHNIALNGAGQEVIFDRIVGTTDQYGQIDLRIIAEPAKTQSVEVNSAGQIQLAGLGAACCDTNRLTDTRHLHLDLGWSIQGATILTLNFPDVPVVTENITMADYFDITPNPTEFDWSGTIDVNGESQTLRIHTHTLDAVNTILCLHRDLDNNSKPLEVLIDGKDIVSYAADGTITVGIFGGTEEIQWTRNFSKKASVLWRES